MGDLHRDLDDLYVGTGRWTDTPAGRAARTLDDADRRLADVRRAAGPQTCRRSALPISGSAGLGATGRTLRASTPAKVITVLFTVR